MSLATDLRKRNRLNQAKIVTLTGLSHDAINTIRFDAAYRYLKDVLQTDDYGMEMLPKTKEFWAWWCIEWGRIDAIFLNKLRTDKGYGIATIENPEDGILHGLKKTDIIDWYLRYHEVSPSNIFINSSVMEASCHQMIMQVTGSVKFNNNY